MHSPPKKIQGKRAVAERKIMYPDDGMLKGIYGLYKKDDCIADAQFNKGRFIKPYAVYRPDRLPPFFPGEEKTAADTVTLQLSQFFSTRLVPQQNRYYHIAKSMQYGRYISLLDDYWLKTDELGYGQVSAYNFEEDGFVQAVLKHMPDGNAPKYSPNLALPFAGLALFEKAGDARFLLQEYSKELADKKHKLGIPYRIRIIHDIPFLCVPLQPGNYYPLDAAMPKALPTGKKKEILKGLDDNFDPGQFDPDSCFIYQPQEKCMVVRYL